MWKRYSASWAMATSPSRAGSRARSVPTTAIRMQPRFISASRAAAGCVRSTRPSNVKPGAFVVHPPGEVHEYINGPARTLLFRVRYGSDMLSRHLEWRGNPRWTQSPGDAEYFRQHPPG